jgi:cell division septum initiation protein DivIVA
MDENGILSEIEAIADIIEQGKPALGNKERRTIDSEAVLDIIDNIRAAYPREVEQARQILREQDGILQDAQAEANRIIEDARQQTLIIASEQEIVRISQIRAEDILADARDMEREMRAGAEEYADRVFSHVENTINQISENIRRCRERLNNRNGH